MKGERQRLSRGIEKERCKSNRENKEADWMRRRGGVKERKRGRDFEKHMEYFSVGY